MVTAVSAVLTVMAILIILAFLIHRKRKRPELHQTADGKTAAAQ
jgi:hypothetical protein